VQALVFAALVAGLAYLVISSADSWADWVVFGVIVVTAFGAAAAVNKREHPTRKRAFTRSSESRR
jgi:O-antigen/teichoic acid export membrane protein